MFNKFEALLLHLFSALKTDVQDYCDLETVDRDAIVASDGSLASVVRLNGARSVLSVEQFERMAVVLTDQLQVFFRDRGHQIQCVFRRDLDGLAALLPNAEAQHATAKRLRMDVGDLIDESVKKYAEYVYDEDCHLVFWSRPSLLDSVETKMAKADNLRFRRETDLPSMKNAQNLLRPIPYLYDRHIAFVAKITDVLQSREFGCSVDLLSVGEMLRAVRRSVLPEHTHPGWEPSVPGRPIPLRWKTNSDARDASEVLYPRLAQQIMTGVAETGSRSREHVPDPTTVALGGRIFAPLLMELPPSDPKFFGELFGAMNRAETIENGQRRAVPYSVSFMLEADGMGVFTLKSVLSMLLGIGSTNNRNINSARKALSDLKGNGASIVKLKICAATWAQATPEGVRELALRKSKLLRAMEGWGNSTVVERSGEPLLAVQSNSVGLTWRHIANAAPAPLEEAVAMLPLGRPASPFEGGSTIYRSLCGKVMCYQRFSSQQLTWITLAAGKPGSGKSALMNNNNVESCLMPGITRLPYVFVQDIGISSSGFIDLIRDNLPDELKHLVVYKRLQNAERDCINVFDTPLRQRKPLSRDRMFLVNFLATLVTPPERKGEPYEGMSDYVGAVIDRAYQVRSDKNESSRARSYIVGHDAIVDAAIAKIGFKTMPATKYWALVDRFFAEGMYFEAEVAQRYAVPIVEDLIGVATEQTFADEYAHMTVSGMPIGAVFAQGAKAAIANFPVFRGHTQFDLGSARVVALDLQDVVVKGGPAAHKQTALMYMVARQCFMKKIAFSDEDLPSFDNISRPYFERLVSELAEDHKVWCMDEYHNTGGHPLLEEQVFADGRQGRKYKLEIILSSQLMSDFGKLASIATTFFVLDSGTEETRSWMRQNIGMSAVEEDALISNVHGPGRHGSTFLAKFVTSSGTYSQLLTLTLGPMRLWALSTTAEDTKLRRTLCKSMSGNEARQLLAAKFPEGSIKKIVERMKLEMKKKNDGFVDEEQVNSVIDDLAAKLVAEHYDSALLIPA